MTPTYEIVGFQDETRSIEAGLHGKMVSYRYSGALMPDAKLLDMSGSGVFIIGNL